jgi:hypothetical protein
VHQHGEEFVLVSSGACAVTALTAGGLTAGNRAGGLAAGGLTAGSLAAGGLAIVASPALCEATLTIRDITAGSTVVTFE